MFARVEAACLWTSATFFVRLFKMTGKAPACIIQYQAKPEAQPRTQKLHVFELSAELAFFALGICAICKKVGAAKQESKVKFPDKMQAEMWEWSRGHHLR